MPPQNRMSGDAANKKERSRDVFQSKNLLLMRYKTKTEAVDIKMTRSFAARMLSPVKTQTNATRYYKRGYLKSYVKLLCEMWLLAFPR